MLEMKKTGLFEPILATWHFTGSDILLPSAAREVIGERAQEVIESIRDKDFETLADFVHPNQGLLFAPYAWINTEYDLAFSAVQLRQLGNDSTEYLWGGYDGSGKPIELTFAGYYDRFIYSQDFAALPVGYNQLLGRGNTVANHFDVFPGAIAVEYHYTGSDSRCDEMSWQSLRLVFQEQAGTWYLVAIVHDEWTI